MTRGAAWLEFAVCLGAVGYSGARLSRYADVLAEKTGLGRTWLGLTALAVVTSLPELVSGVSAVTWAKVPEVAVGTLLGASVLNLLILGVADLFHRPAPVLTAAGRGHLMAATFAVILLAIAGLGLMPIPENRTALSLGHLGLSSPVLIICYLMAMRATYRYQQREFEEFLAVREETETYPHIGLGEALAKFSLHAAVVVAAALWLPGLAHRLAQLMGWHLSLVGTVFVAAVTTTPELVVTLSALRLGAVDLAVGDLLGSVMVNTAMLGVMDCCYLEGPLLRAVSPQHAATALMAILMTSIATAEMVYRPPKKLLRHLSLGAFLLAFLYALNVSFLMLARP